MSEYGSKENKIEAGIFVGKSELIRPHRAIGIINTIVDVDVGESEIRMPNGYSLCAPVNGWLNDIEPLIGSISIQVTGKGDGHSANTTSNIQNLFVWFEMAELDKIF